jgi:hypothetical protein
VPAGDLADDGHLEQTGEHVAASINQRTRPVSIGGEQPGGAGFSFQIRSDAGMSGPNNALSEQLKALPAH